VSTVRLQSNIDPTFYRMLGAKEKLALLESFTIRRPTVDERMAAGKALRQQVPRASHAVYHGSTNRSDPIEILERQNATRVKKLVPVRYNRMLASPFAFLRGSAAVMASDLSTLPVSGIKVAACGDMHVCNFGVYATAERNLVFAINDFDEIHVGPWEWDLKRLAASAAVAVDFLGGNKAQAEEAARARVCSYRKHIRRYAEMGHLKVWYDRIDESVILDSLRPKARRIAKKVMARARARGHIATLDKLTERVNGRSRFVEDVPLIVRETHTERGTPVKVALDRFLRVYIDSLSYDRRVLLARSIPSCTASSKLRSEVEVISVILAAMSSVTSMKTWSPSCSMVEAVGTTPSPNRMRKATRAPLDSSSARSGWVIQSGWTGTSIIETVLVGSRHSSTTPPGTRWRTIRSAVQRTVATVGMPSRS